MARSKIDDAGRTTIPRSVRLALRLRPGDRIDYLVEGGRVTISSARSTLDDLMSVLPKPPRGTALAEMDAVISEGTDERARRR